MRRHNLLWSRLLLVPGMEAASELLQQRRVLVVGAGGLGAGVALHLAGCHIGRLTLVDGDIVSESNIPHSLVFQPRHVGRPKVEVVRQVLRAKFPGIHVLAEQRFIQECSPTLFQEHDLIVCAPDNNQTRRWVNYWAVHYGKPALFVGVGGPQMEWIGYVFLYQPGESACFVCFDTGGVEQEAPEEVYKMQESGKNLEERRRKCGGENMPAPLLSPMVGAVASYAAAVALKKLVDVAPTAAYTLVDLKYPLLLAKHIPPVSSCSVCGALTEFEIGAM